MYIPVAPANSTDEPGIYAQAGGGPNQTESLRSLGDIAFTDERDLFRKARKALSENELEEFQSLFARLAHYPLYRYLEFQLIRYIISESPDKHAVSLINQFEKAYVDQSLTKQLTRHLQNELVKTGQWPLYLALSKSRLAKNQVCAAARARDETQGLKKWDPELLEYWSQHLAPPETCAAVFEKLANVATPSIAAIWERIYKGVGSGRLDDVRNTFRWLSSSDKSRLTTWIEARSTPAGVLEATHQHFAKDDLLSRRAVLDLVRRWSREDTGAAIAWWQERRLRYTFFDDERYQLDRELALRSAWKRMPEAYVWLYGFEVREDDLEVMEWRIRAALRAEKWPDVLKSLLELPAHELAEDHWAYWHARALEKSGRKSESLDVFRTVAQLPTYYGFLAADRVQQSYQIRDVPIAGDAQLLDRLASLPALVRAREYHRVGILWEARREWGDTLKSLTNEEVAATAILARQWRMPDRSIVSANAAGQKAALSYRFPIAFEAEVADAARAYEIEPALIYGIMRRESALMADIRSPVGAVGLMQLMPNTAQYVSDLMGRGEAKFNLTEPSINIDFGSFYYRHVLNQFDDHPALGAASYNAGPHRTKAWLKGKGEVEADLWIDTIPFSETRRYVRAVLAYATIFQWQLQGTTTRLSDRLPIVRGSLVAAEVSQ